MSRRFALLIGNGEYDDPRIERLATPTRDVHALAELLKDPGVGGFDSVEELLDEPEARIRRSISAFFRNRSRDDLLVLYFSGHGIKDDRGRLFWVARDTQQDDLLATGISAAYVAEHMDGSPSKRQVLILDCCYGGAFVAGSKGDSRVISQTTFEGNGYGRVVLTASDSTQYAREGDQVVRQAQLSLFTHYLIEGLSSGAAARPGAEVISLNDWYDYAYEQVVSRLPTQTPCKWSYNQQGELIIARNPRPTPLPPARLPSELVESLRDPRPWVRLGAVPELGSLLRGGDRRMVLAARQALEELSEDDSLKVRREVARVLEESGQSAPSETTISPEPATAGRDRSPEVRVEELHFPPREEPAAPPAEHTVLPAEPAGGASRGNSGTGPARTPVPWYGSPLEAWLQLILGSVALALVGIFVLQGSPESDSMATINTSPCAAADTLRLAGSLRVGSDVSGTLNDEHGHDTYSLYVADGATLDFEVTSGEFAPWLALLDENRNLLQSGGGTAGDKAPLVTRYLGPGCYLVEVQRYQYRGAGSYTLRILPS